MSIEIVTYADEHFGGVGSLWREAFPEDPPWNNAASVIPAKIAFQQHLFFVALETGRVIGSLMAGYDGHRGWVNRIAVLRSHQGQGVGSALMRKAEAQLRIMGCTKINLQVRTSNAQAAEFYRRLGYAIEDRISMSKRIAASALHDDPGTIAKTVDIGERAQSESDMRAQMHELVHRVKNDMQVLRSLLSAAERETENAEAREVLADAARRVSTVAAVQHGIVTQGTESFDTRSFLEALGRNASQSFGRKADIEIDAASGSLPNKTALPLALIVNELITNAVKHGKGERNHVSVKLSLVNRDKESILSVQDDGPGFVPGPPRKRASGLGLVTALAGQLGGKLDVTTNHGARCTVRFGASTPP